MALSISLSERQENILKFISSFVTKNDYPPTIRQIGEEVGISSTSVVNYNLDKLAKHELIVRHREVSRGLSLNWDRIRDSGLGQLLGLDNSQSSVQPTYDESDSAFFQIPVLGHIAAGEPIQVEPRDAATAEDHVEVARTMFKLSGNIADYFALRVSGDSMVDASVLDGDVVILRHQDTADDGDMVAAWIEGDEETTLKFLHREGANVRLEPANPNYDPIIRSADRVLINGKVVSVLRYLN